jgi:hypothetical protein
MRGEKIRLFYIDFLEYFNITIHNEKLFYFLPMLLLMYFHLIGIKEKDDQQYQLDILIGGEEITTIKEFLEDW